MTPHHIAIAIIAALALLFAIATLVRWMQQPEELPVSEEQVERVARAIHDARYGNDYPLTLVNTWEQEGVSGQQYCLRLARAAIEAMPDERALKLVEALRGVRSMLAGYAGQPNHMGDIYKVVDAALADSQPAGERR